LLDPYAEFFTILNKLLPVDLAARDHREIVLDTGPDRRCRVPFSPELKPQVSALDTLAFL
jgi:hypothetical protein